jgi:hypothetical protein
MKLGRPLKFSSVEEMEKAASAYFEATPKEEWTITGLALALDTSRKVLVEYEERDEFSNAIKKMKTMVENSYELSLRKSGRSGDIFGLKNFGWKDKNETDVTSGGDKIQGVVILPPKNESTLGTTTEASDSSSVN